MACGGLEGGMQDERWESGVTPKAGSIKQMMKKEEEEEEAIKRVMINKGESSSVWWLRFNTSSTCLLQTCSQTQNASVLL